MRKIVFLFLLFSFAISGKGQKKSFFDNIDMALNIHIGDASIEKNSWPDLFRENKPSYNLDSFNNADRGWRCIMIPFIPTSASADVRVSKTLFPSADHKLLAERIEWRSGLFVGSKVETYTSLTDIDYNQWPQPTPYRYRELGFTYKRFWIDYSNQIVYKIPSWLLRKRLKYYIGGGAGLTYEANSTVSENFDQFLVTQNGGAYTVTNEINAIRTEKVNTVTSIYLNATAGSEFKISTIIYFLFEGNYQGYIKSFSLKERLYREGGYFSAIFRYRF